LSAGLRKGSERRVYAWIWRHLPGVLWVRVLWALILFAVVVFVLFQFVFPWLEPQLPFSGNGSLSR
jgi:hypothetical protein